MAISITRCRAALACPSRHLRGNQELLGRYSTWLRVRRTGRDDGTWNRLFNACEWYELRPRAAAIEGLHQPVRSRRPSPAACCATPVMSRSCAQCCRAARWQGGDTFAESVSDGDYPSFGRRCCVSRIQAAHHRFDPRAPYNASAAGFPASTWTRSASLPGWRCARHGAPWHRRSVVGEHARLLIVHGNRRRIDADRGPYRAGPAPSPLDHPPGESWGRCRTGARRAAGNVCPGCSRSGTFISTIRFDPWP